MMRPVAGLALKENLLGTGTISIAPPPSIMTQRIASRPDSAIDDRIRVDYHVHTSYSYDCRTSLEAVLERAARAGLGCLCVTDHDTIEGALALRQIRPPELEIVVGCEFTVSDGSHLIGLGLTEMIFEDRLRELVKRIKEQGASVLLPHPFRRSSGIFRNEMRRSDAFVAELLSSTDMVECFNGGDSYHNNQRNYSFVTERGVPAVASSDAHTDAEIGSVFVEYASAKAVHGVSARRVFFSSQLPVTENRLKTAVMEFYHEHKTRMPGPVRAGYRLAHQRRATDRRRRVVSAPSLQYEFGGTVSLGRSGEG